MALLGASQKLIVVLVLIVAALAMVVGLFIGHSLTFVPLDTTPHYFQNYGLTGCGGEPGNALLDATQYVTSWNTNGASEKIVVQGGYFAPGFSLTSALGYRFHVYTTQDGATWTERSDSPITPPMTGTTIIGTSCVVKPGIVYVLYGPYSGGLKVTLEVHIWDGVVDQGWNTMGVQESYLVAGIGHINADAQAQVGQVAHATVTVGYLTDKAGNPGWKLWAFSTAQNRIVLGPILSNTSAWNQQQQAFSYQVQAADFSSSAGTCGNGNRIEWHLFNSLFPKDEAWTTTVDVSALSPSFKFSGWTGQPVAGGAVNVSWTATPNPTTGLPLSKVVIGYGYGSTQNFLNLSGNATSAQIPLGSNGQLRINGYAIDSGCRPAPSDTLLITVFPRGQGPGSSGPPNWLLFFVVIVVFGAIGGLVAWLSGAPVLVRVLLFALFLIVGLVVAIFIVPAVLVPSLYAILPQLLRGGG